MLKNIMYARFKIFLIVIVTVILISCSEKKEHKSEVKPGSSKSPDKISSAGIKEGETEFRVEYDLPRRIYLIEKEDLIAVEKGQVLTAPKQGWFISDYWLKQVGEAKVERK